MRPYLAVLCALAWVGTASAADTHANHQMAGAPAPCAGTTLACAIAATPTIAQDGSLYVAWAAGGQVSVARSTDHGKSFAPAVAVNATVARNNIGEVEALLNFLVARKAAAFHVFSLVPVGCGAQISPDARLSSDEIETFLRWLFTKSIELRDRIHIKATCAPQYYRIMRAVSKEKGIPLPGAGHAPGHPGGHPPGHGHGAANGMEAMTRGCLAGSAVCFISRIGDVQPCGYLPVQVGNVLKQPFGEIWSNSGEFAALRDTGQLKGKCGACGYRTVCEGCRARAYAATGDFMSQDPDCSFGLKL